MMDYKQKMEIIDMINDIYDDIENSEHFIFIAKKREDGTTLGICDVNNLTTQEVIDINTANLKIIIKQAIDEIRKGNNDKRFKF